MRMVLARLADDVELVSVVAAGDTGPGHVYEIVGGPDSGLRFDSLLAAGEYVRASRQGNA